LSEIIDIDALTMFTADELRLLISGAGKIDLNELSIVPFFSSSPSFSIANFFFFSSPEINTMYSGGYSATHEEIKWLWEILESFDGLSFVVLLDFICLNSLFLKIFCLSVAENQRSKFLHFVTSCSRAPLLGFSSLYPKFCIQRVERETESSLPTSSTCMNILRLPRYSSKATLRERLLYAISSGAGFDLT
jgi:ubiquitin-protein ligase E3 C